MNEARRTVTPSDTIVCSDAGLAPPQAAELIAEVVIEADGWHNAGVGVDVVQHWLSQAWELESTRQPPGHQSMTFPSSDRGVSVGVLLCDDAAIRRLNCSFRDKDAATNVLAFPSGDDGGTLADPLSPLHLGDIALAYETTAGEAERDGKSLIHHSAHLTVHGFLHLLGYDHDSEVRAVEMEGRETEILATLGIADPYA